MNFDLSIAHPPNDRTLLDIGGAEVKKVTKGGFCASGHLTNRSMSKAESYMTFVDLFGQTLVEETAV